jgi:ankyrin repeat protein
MEEDDQKEMYDALNKMDHGTIDKLIDKGADVSMELEEEQTTPLLIAAGMGDWNTVDKLLAVKGVFESLDYSDEFGYTALHCAVFSIGSRCILPPTIRDHIQANKDPLQVVKSLLSKGVDMNPLNQFNETPLHIAIIGENKEIVEVLLANGADPNMVNKNPPELRLVMERRPDIVALIEAETQRRVLIATEAEQAQCVAFAMGAQERLGEESPVLSLDPELVKMVLNFV